MVDPNCFPTRVYEEKRPLPTKVTVTSAAKRNGREKFELLLAFPKEMKKPDRTISKVS
jgi:hypothetical protein